MIKKDAICLLLYFVEKKEYYVDMTLVYCHVNDILKKNKKNDVK